MFDDMDKLTKSKKFNFIMLFINMLLLALWTTDLINDFRSDADGGMVMFHGFFTGMSLSLVYKYSMKVSEYLKDVPFFGEKKSNPFEEDKSKEETSDNGSSKEKSEDIKDTEDKSSDDKVNISSEENNKNE